MSKYKPEDKAFFLAKAMELSKQGVPQYKIAKQIGVSQGTVNAWLAKEKKKPTVIVHGATTPAITLPRKEAKTKATERGSKIICLIGSPAQIAEAIGSL
jgi:predicted transcriptional regulator